MSSKVDVNSFKYLKEDRSEIYAEYTNGDQMWFYDDKISKALLYHRLDGPAVILKFSDRTENEWWYMDNKIECSSQEEFEKLLSMKAFW